MVKSLYFIAIGSQRPKDAELADELLRDLDKDSANDDANVELDLQLTENETITDSAVTQNLDELKLKLRASDGNDNTGKDKINSENEPTQDTNDLNLKLTESEHTKIRSEENSEDLKLQITQSNSQKSSVDQKGNNTSYTRTEDDTTEGEIVNGNNTAEDDSVLSEKSEKGTELKLKLSVSDSENMDVDDS